MEKYGKYTVELRGVEANAIVRALLKYREDIRSSSSWIAHNASKHEEMIELLKGNKDNKIAKKRLSQEKKSLRKLEEELFEYKKALITIDLLIDKYRHLDIDKNIVKSWCVTCEADMFGEKEVIKVSNIIKTHTKERAEKLAICILYGQGYNNVKAVSCEEIDTLKE